MAREGRGGARPGSGSPPNLNKTADLLARQIRHIEHARDVPPVALALHAVRFHVLAARLRALSGMDDAEELLPGLTRAQAERMTAEQYDQWFEDHRDKIGL